MLMMQDRPRGLFGGGSRMAGRTAGITARELLSREPALPGVISGFGGGTWNVDGSVATLPDRLGEGMSTPSVVSATAGGWDGSVGEPSLPAGGLPRVDGGEPIRGEVLPPLSAPRGIFGSKTFAPRALPDSSNAQQAWSATAMGVLPNTANLPRRGMVQPFDYDATMAALLPPRKKRSTLEKIATVALPALMALGGNQAGANAFTQMQWAKRNDRERREAEAAETIAKWKYADHARQMGADLRASAPRVIGRSMVQYDPQAGEVEELYDGPEDFENYAAALGIEEGSDEWAAAVEDYVLKSDGPSAYERDKGLDDYRTGNRLEIEGVRQGHRESLEGLRQHNRITTKGTPTYRDRNPRSRGGGDSVPTSTGPNGEKAYFRGGQWVDAAGRPIR